MVAQEKIVSESFQMATETVELDIILRVNAVNS